MATIRHIAIFSDDPEKLAGFYSEVYGMKITGRSKGDVWVTDGYMDVALISRKSEKAPRGIHHFGFTLDPDEKAAVYEKQKASGKPPYDPRAENPEVDRPFVEDAAHDPDGNRFDLSTGKRDMETEKARMEKVRAGLTATAK
jgi:catechol 2,3-dioxygenase-like lactoylglutathione lyase family enzyme